MLSKHILTAKSMIIMNLKIQILAGNSLKLCVGVGFEISLTLVLRFVKGKSGKFDQKIVKEI